MFDFDLTKAFLLPIDPKDICDPTAEKEEKERSKGHSTCFNCSEKDICPCVWDNYNADGDCLYK